MTGSTGMLAFAFVNPALLAGLGLVALPIVIHLLSRRRYRRIDWAATHFLLLAERENRRRVRFEQWLLVALRCLVMALLALLVARPYVQPGAVASLLAGGGGVERVVILDDSASLAHRAAGATDFERLRTAATRLVAALAAENRGDSLVVFVTSQPDRPLIEPTRLGVAESADIRARLEQLAPTAAPARPQRVLARVAQELGARSETRAHLYLLSDFQRTDWFSGAAGGAGAFEPLRALEGLDVRATLIAATSQLRENVALVEIGLPRPQTLTGNPAALVARVRNFGARPQPASALHMEIDGAALPAATVDALDPGAERLVSLEVTFPERGTRLLSARLGSADGLVLDDVRRIGVGVTDTLNVLLVSGKSGADPAQNEAYLPRSALAPPGPFSSGLTIEVIDAGELEGAVLDNYDCVFLCNAAPPTEPGADLLSRYVRSGGGLAIFLGDQVGTPEEYNRRLWADGAGVLPVPLAALATGQTGAGVGLRRAAEHPLAVMFPGAGEALSEYVHFRSYYRVVEPAAAPPSAAPASQPVATSNTAAAVVLARFADADGTPALIERASGSGRVVLFTSTIGLDWNDWARSVDGSYVVTLLEMVQHVARRDPNPREFLAGQPLRLTLSAETFDPEVVLRSPAYPDEPAQSLRAKPTGESAQDHLLVEAAPPRMLGVYQADLARRGGAVETRPLSVNLDPNESDLAVAAASELDAALGRLPHDYLNAADAVWAGEGPARRELWRTLLIVLFGVLLTEQAVAWWFGRVAPHRRRGLLARA